MNTPRRERFSQSPLPVPVTYATDIGIYDCENFILEQANELHKFGHWLAHLIGFYLAVHKKRNPYLCGDDFPRLRQVIADSLGKANYYAEAEEIAKASDEESMNQKIIRQYTAESALYPEINALLRLGHMGHNVGDHPLAPWILQLNSAIRCLPEYYGITYRGAQFSNDDLAMYSVGKLYVWSSFTSSSKSPDVCLGGNVLFELIPVCAIAEHDKRSGRDISYLSAFPEEQEILLPICCAFRITEIDTNSAQTRIRAEILDMN